MSTQSCLERGVGASAGWVILRKSIVGLYRCSVVGQGMIELAEAYLRTRDVSKGYAANVRRTAKSMQAAGITPANVNAERVSHWLSSLRVGLSATSVANSRRMALTLWRYGFDCGLIAAPCRGVGQIKVARKPTRAWTRSQLTEAVKVLPEKFSGTLKSGCPRALFLEAWFRLGVETGLRFGDMHELAASALCSGGIAVTASKTGLPVVRPVSEKTMAQLSTLARMSPDGSVFSWALSRRHTFCLIRDAFKALGLGDGRSQWLRRSAATMVEMAHPGTAGAFLGHATPGLADRHYIDHSQLMDRLPAPPPLE